MRPKLVWNYNQTNTKQYKNSYDYNTIEKYTMKVIKVLILFRICFIVCCQMKNEKVNTKQYQNSYDYNTIEKYTMKVIKVFILLGICFIV